jgi:pyridinium-3,5-bisthiocarboxylic acid mononucleotide nickel chelatase
VTPERERAARAAAELRGAHLHVDCASGAAGDMLLAALLDLGVPEAAVAAALDAIGANSGRLKTARVIRHGLAALDVKVDTAGHVFDAHDHGGAHARHAHDAAPQHDHVHYRDIRARIAGAAVAGGGKTRALDIFDRLARAEAKLHGTPVDDIAFHEVGAIDSIVDVVGCAAALDWLAPRSVSCAEVAMGHGTLRCAHGVLPVPAPAALEVLRDAGGVTCDGGVARELCTPTGAAVLAATVTAWQPAPTGTPIAVGWGAGDVELDDRANVVRVVALAVRADHRDSVWQLEANIDDMTPELCAAASEAVLVAGALDAWWTPITMKKGRPALLLSALVDDAGRDAVVAAILRETTTIGVRYARRERTVLARRSVDVATRYGTVAVKLAVDGDIVRNAAPEYEACAAAARAHGVPVKLVYAAALAAWAAKESL